MEQKLGMTNETTTSSEEYITGSEVLLRGLLQEGVECVFGYPGRAPGSSSFKRIRYSIRFDIPIRLPRLNRNMSSR